MRQIPLTHGQVALVDEKDAACLPSVKWHAIYNARTKKWYATASLQHGMKVRTVYMHRYILNAPQGMHVDHINGDGLDNRRSNLRLATRSQNQHNRRTQYNNATGYKGVSYFKNDRSYWMQFQVNGRRVRVGGFKTAMEAAKAYDRLAREHHGAFARLNFPGNSEQKA